MQVMAIALLLHLELEGGHWSRLNAIAYHDRY